MRLARSIALIALTLGSACSVIVQPSDDRVRCEVNGGVDPCPAGQRCLDGVCTTLPDGGNECMEQETGCNGLDDDCDGTIDEGSDLDDDGFQWCANDPGLRDCRDDDPAIHPGGPDTPAPVDVPCDGADNDCSGSAAECPDRQVCHPDGGCRAADCSFAYVCPPMQRCNLELEPPNCEPVTVDCTLPGSECTGGMLCDPVSRACIPPRGLGEACAFDEQCAAGTSCFDTAALGLRSIDVGGSARVCSSPCCADSDCPVGATCWASGTGARGCVPTALLAGGPSGAPADQACGRNGQCSNTCALRPSPAYDRPDRYAFTCGAPIGSGTGACNSPSDCASGVCLRDCDGFICDYYCRAPCGRNADCDSLEYCGYVRTGGGYVAQSCVPRDSFGDGAQGSACGSSSDCRGVACLTAASGNYCADACCTDTDCGSAAYACLPRRFDGFWAMLCQQR